ncbi:Cysteine-rich membrane protein 2 [Spironucleus salmonicida]|uniref:Cysteine-rich membrane protein 2 n=1 Tax=Spironucleus salmonicida TaxID=348837 RepID=V6LG53_9EUKA|nr:Cysteine-rich membrane protein 2 [Spironucleus salmonicida]KAH0571152.1 Cysteine-rich membrane protein 2 [Spironucleus salmonicida]|eukprot:EST43258.1 Cysteine-rich membrane protein 2 [Spironucleus salmonicida]
MQICNYTHTPTCIPCDTNTMYLIIDTFTQIGQCQCIDLQLVPVFEHSFMRCKLLEPNTTTNADYLIVAKECLNSQIPALLSGTECTFCNAQFDAHVGGACLHNSGAASGECALGFSNLDGHCTRCQPGQLAFRIPNSSTTFCSSTCPAPDQIYSPPLLSCGTPCENLAIMGLIQTEVSVQNDQCICRNGAQIVYTKSGLQCSFCEKGHIQNRMMVAGSIITFCRADNLNIFNQRCPDGLSVFNGLCDCTKGDVMIEGVDTSECQRGVFPVNNLAENCENGYIIHLHLGNFTGNICAQDIQNQAGVIVSTVVGGVLLLVAGAVVFICIWKAHAQKRDFLAAASPPLCTDQGMHI